MSSSPALISPLKIKQTSLISEYRIHIDTSDQTDMKALINFVCVCVCVCVCVQLINGHLINSLNEYFYVLIVYTSKYGSIYSAINFSCYSFINI